MIYHLLYPLHRIDELSFLNVLRYVPFRVLAATMTAMLLTFGLTPWFIRTLQSRQIGQVVRSDGPETHLSKAGTPTMGGSLILLALVGSTMLWADPGNTMVWLVTAVTVLYGAIGYADDALKISRKHSGGLSMRTKLLLQFPIAIAICAYLYYAEAGLPADWLAIRDRLSIPFVAFAKHPLPPMPPWLYVAFATICLVGTSNAVNLTDGLDGLAIVPVMIAAASFGLISYLAGNAVFAEYLQIHYVAGSGELAIICGAVIGAGLGFLWFNAPPASIFMGDTGSLSLGGLLGTVAVAIKHEIVLAIIGGLFVLEAVSVIVQVVSFKLTGKRVFKMAPIHHHYEQLGWTEPQIVIRFWIVAVVLALAGLASLKLR